MQHLKEFLTGIQTFDLHVIEDDIYMEWGIMRRSMSNLRFDLPDPIL